MRLCVFKDYDEDKYVEILSDAVFSKLNGEDDEADEIFESIIIETELSKRFNNDFGRCGVKSFIQYALLSPRIYKAIENIVKRKSDKLWNIDRDINYWIKLFPVYESKKVSVIARFLNILSDVDEDEVLDLLIKLFGKWVDDKIVVGEGSILKIHFESVEGIINKQSKKDGIKIDNKITRLSLYVGLLIFLSYIVNDCNDMDCIVFPFRMKPTVDAVAVNLVAMFSSETHFTNDVNGERDKSKYFDIPKKFNLSEHASLVVDKEYGGMFSGADEPAYLAMMVNSLLKGTLHPQPTNAFYQFNQDEIELLNIQFENLWDNFFDDTHIDRYKLLTEEDLYYFTKMLLVYLLPLISDLNKSREMFIFEDSKKSDINKQLNEKIAEINNQLSSSKQTIENLNKKLKEKDKALAQFEYTKLNLSITEEENIKLLQRIKELEEQLESDTKPQIIAEDFTKSEDYNRLYEYLNSKDVSIIGGWGNWIKKIKVELPNVKFYEPERLSKSLDSIKKDKLVIFNSSANNHGMYYMVKNIVKDSSIPLVYISTQASNFDVFMLNMSKELKRYNIE